MTPLRSVTTSTSSRLKRAIGVAPHSVLLSTYVDGVLYGVRNVEARQRPCQEPVGLLTIASRARISAASAALRRSGPKRIAGTEQEIASRGGSTSGRATA